MMTTRLLSGLSLTAFNPLPQRTNWMTAARVRTKKNRNRGPKKRGQKMAPCRDVFGLRLHFTWGRKMATLFVLRNRTKKTKKNYAEATRVPLMFD